MPPNRRSVARAFFVTLLFQAAIAAQTFAAEDAPRLVSESEFFSDIPSVDSVTRLPQPKSETPAAVTIIGSKMIRASGARYVQDLFRLVPGFQVAYAGQNNPVVTYHGLADVNARRMLILVDGRSAYGAISGDVEWNNIGIAIEDIERIEITRGPNTVTYGDNAFLATINIITRHAAQTQTGTAKLTGGNHAIRDGLARAATHFDSGDIRLTAGYLSEDGYQDELDDLRSGFINLRSDLHPGARDTVLLQFGINRTNAEVGSPTSALNPPATREQTGHFEQIRWQRRFAGNDNDLSVHFYHNSIKSDLDYLSAPFTAGPLGLVQVPIIRDSMDERYDLEAQHSFRPWSAFRLVWGLGAREDRAESAAAFSSNEILKNRSSRVFGNADLRATPDTILSAGVLWEDNDITEADISSRLAVNYHLNSQHTLRAAATRAQRVPSLAEEFGDRRITFMGFLLDHDIANTYSLSNETMDSVEIGYLGRFPAADLTLDMRLYRDHIRDFITHTLVPAADFLDGQALALQNEGDVTIDGIEFDLSYQPDRDTRIVFTSAFMRAMAEEFSSASVYSAQQFEDSVPRYSGSLLAMQDINSAWSVSLGYYWVDEMVWLLQSTSSNRPPVSSYTRLDLRLARRLRLGDVRGELALVVQNAGSDYQDFRRNRLFGTRSFVSLALDL